MPCCIYYGWLTEETRRRSANMVVFISYQALLHPQPAWVELGFDSVDTGGARSSKATSWHSVYTLDLAETT